MSKEVMVSNLKPYIGSYVEFLFNFGWGDEQIMRGYLHGMSPMEGGYSDYLHISDNPKLEEGSSAASLGGFAMAYSDLITILEAP